MKIKLIKPFIQILTLSTLLSFSLTTKADLIEPNISINQQDKDDMMSLIDEINSIRTKQNVDAAQAIKIKAKEITETVKKTTYERYSKASFYAQPFHGRKTANGEVFNMHALTAAAANHIPMNCKIKVTNVENGKSVIVKVNDRGNFKRYGRDLDLSKAAFASIANLNKGVVKIKYEILD